MSPTPKEVFERYVWAAMTRDADAQAELFTVDGVFEAPLVPPGGVFPGRVEGREEIRAFLGALHQRTATRADRKVNVERSRYVLHTSTDPDVFIAEIDTAFDEADGVSMMSLVQIFRLRDGRIALMRDYFSPEYAD